MIVDRRSYRLRVLICACFLLVLVIYLYTNFIRIHLPNNSLTQVLTTLFVSSYNLTSNGTVDKVLTHDKPLTSTPTEAFVTFISSNPAYVALVSKLLDSIHHFSTRPIIVYEIDVDLDLNLTKYPRLIKRRVSQKDCGRSVYFCKIFAIVDSKLDYGVQVDIDSVVNWNIDILFDVVRKWPYPLPLAPRHPGDPLNYEKFLRRFGLNLKSRTIPYIHAQFLWNYRANAFFQKALRLMREQNFYGANLDETGINILLWQAKANHTLCKVDPFHGYISSYESQEKICKEDCHTAFIIFHGSKNVTEMHDIFERLKNHTGSPFIQTPREGFHYLNETQYTCCAPDSQPSPIHPLICQYPTWNS